MGTRGLRATPPRTTRVEPYHVATYLTLSGDQANTSTLARRRRRALSFWMFLEWLQRLGVDAPPRRRRKGTGRDPGSQDEF